VSQKASAFNNRRSTDDFVLRIRHVEHSGQVPGCSDLLSSAANLHRALIRVVEIEVRFSEADGGADFNQGVGPGPGLSVVETEKSLLRMRSRMIPKTGPLGLSESEYQGSIP